MIGWGALILRKHTILMNGFGSFQENLQTENRDKKESSQGTMGRPMLLLYNRMKKHPRNRMVSTKKRIERVRSLISNFDKPSGTCPLALVMELIIFAPIAKINTFNFLRLFPKHHSITL